VYYKCITYLKHPNPAPNALKIPHSTVHTVQQQRNRKNGSGSGSRPLQFMAPAPSQLQSSNIAPGPAPKAHDVLLAKSTAPLRNSSNGANKLTWTIFRAQAENI